MEKMVAAMAKQLAGYDEPGQLAAARTQALLLKLQSYHAAMEKMVADIDAAVGNLDQVWRITELHASCDAGEADVIEKLQSHNAVALTGDALIDVAVELAIADAIDDISTPLNETGKRWQFTPELSPDPVRRAQRMAIHAQMSPREREVTVDRFHRRLERVKYFASGAVVDANFLVSLL